MKLEDNMTDKRITILDLIIEDTKADVEKFNHKPFDGKTVGEYFGCIGAQVATLAKIMKFIIEEK